MSTPFLPVSLNPF